MKETTENFDDRKLINLARFHFFSSKEDKQVEDIKDLFSKEKLSNLERNKLLSFIESTKYLKPLSMTDMKREIFGVIGYPEGNSYNQYSNTLNRSEVEKIFNFIKSLKK